MRNDRWTHRPGALAGHVAGRLGVGLHSNDLECDSGAIADGRWVLQWAGCGAYIPKKPPKVVVRKPLLTHL